jgi:hypothetical protein
MLRWLIVASSPLVYIHPDDQGGLVAVRLLDGFESTAENVSQGLIPCIEEAGFSRSEETHREATLFGTLSLYRAERS